MGDVVHDVVEVVVLGRHRAEVGDGVLEGRVDPGPAEGLLQPVGGDLGVGLGHRRVAHDGTAHPVAVAGRRADGDEAAHRVAHDHRRPGDVAGPGHGHHLVGPLLERVRRAVPAVTVAGQVEAHHPELLGEGGGHVGPPVGMGPAAVDEDQASGARACRRSGRGRRSRRPRPSGRPRGTARARTNQDGASGSGR